MRCRDYPRRLRIRQAFGVRLPAGAFGQQHSASGATVPPQPLWNNRLGCSHGDTSVGWQASPQAQIVLEAAPSTKPQAPDGVEAVPPMDAVEGLPPRGVVEGRVPPRPDGDDRMEGPVPPRAPGPPRQQSLPEMHRRTAGLPVPDPVPACPGLEMGRWPGGTLKRFTHLRRLRVA